jgi:hypothetical protein
MVNLKRINEGGTFVWSETASQLTAPGDTGEVTIEGSTDHTAQITIASINTNVVVQLEGSVDSTNFMILPLEGAVVTGLAITNNVATITANGTYLLYVKDVAIKDIHLTFVSEAGGTAATIDTKFYSQS